MSNADYYASFPMPMTDAPAGQEGLRERIARLAARREWYGNITFNSKHSDGAKAVEYINRRWPEHTCLADDILALLPTATQAEGGDEIARLRDRLAQATNALGYDRRMVVKHLREWPVGEPHTDTLGSEYVGRLMREAADVIEFQNPTPAPAGDVEAAALEFFGFAPGNYMITCGRCGGDGNGECHKLASVCRECAAKRVAEISAILAPALRPSPPSATGGGKWPEGWTQQDEIARIVKRRHDYYRLACPETREERDSEHQQTAREILAAIGVPSPVLIDALEKAREALKGAEFGCYDLQVELASCPSCAGSERTGHTGDCALVAALTALEAALPGGGGE